MNPFALFLLSLGHAITDISQGVLPILLPFFKETFRLSYTSVGFIVLASNLSSSIVQPIFGYWSDRIKMPWLVPGGCFLSGAGLTLAGLATNDQMLFIGVVLGGLGVAAFHPEASKAAHLVSGERKATSMALFSVGGNLGFGVGPLLGVLFLKVNHWLGTLIFLLPGAVMAIVLARVLPRIISAHLDVQPDPKAPGHPETGASKVRVSSLLQLIGIVITRSWIHAGLATYIPLYYISYLKGDPAYASTLLTVFLIAGAVGTLLGGPMADRWGRKNLIIISMVFTLLALFLFRQVTGFWLLASVALTGFGLISTFSTTVVLGQELMPRNVGMASGLMLGFAIGTGGLGVTLLGVVSDHWGVPVALNIITILPVLGLLLAFFLPETRLVRRSSR